MIPKIAHPLRRLSRLVAAGAVSIALSVTLSAQEGQYDHGTAPQHAAGVSPLGSYTSADLGTINLTNGALNFKLPLGSVGGRGLGVPLTLNYSSKVWSASRDSSFADETGYHPVAYAAYADIENLIDIYSRVAPGWTIGALPTLIARGSGINDNQITTCTGDFKYALTKLTVILPDKGEIQLRDDATNGAPLAAQAISFPGCTFDDGNRGSRWHATDGSGLVFVSDAGADVTRGNLNGVLITSDGTRYRFINVSGGYGGGVDLIKNLGRAVLITDRNGNTVQISYPNGIEVDYTDQLGRITKVQKNVVDPQNSSVTLALLVTLPGYQGQTGYYKVKTALMNQIYRAGINPTLPVINGDYDPLGWGLSWGTATRLFALSHGLDAQRIDTAVVLSEFVLPDGRSVQFFYNEFGEVAEARLPTGGKLQYDYQYVSTLPAGKSLSGEVSSSHFYSDVSDSERAVVTRRVYADGVSLDATWSYNYTISTTQVTATAASGPVLLNQKHYFLARGRDLYIASTPPGVPGPDRGVDGSGYSLWSTGVERRTETLNAAGTAVMAASEQDWTQRTAIVWTGTTYASYQAENDNRVNEERRILDTGSVAKVKTFYDQYNNPTETQEYDYDATLKRRTTTTYVVTNNGYNYQTDDSIHLLRLPLVQTVYDGAGPHIAQTVNEYDVYSNDGNRALLTDYYPVSQHDASYGVAKTTRGNVTRSDQWLNTTSSFIYSYPRYDTLGNVVSAKDANGNVTTISFADDFGDGSNPGSHTNNPVTPTYALPTLVTSPPPLPGQPAHTASSQYDFSTGLLTGFKDRNGIITQTLYCRPCTTPGVGADPFNRPTLIKSALNQSTIETRAVIYYAQTTIFGITLAKNDVLTAKDQNTLDDANLRSWTVTDGFGRTKETWSRDPQGDVKVITNYDALGRAYQSSNPFRPSLGESAVYTTTAFDLAGRVISITTPDSAVVTTSYSGNTVTVTDQMLKKRKSVTDALGRLKEVYEDPTSLNYLTSYSYDVLDDLTTVVQGSQTRTFFYNSLKRLTSATNPESGTISYQYDNNGNLTQKTDARAVVTTYAYDALNRNKSVSYTNDPAGTPTTNRYYDGWRDGQFTNIPNVNGRLWQAETTGSTGSRTTLNSFDATGRPLSQSQQFYADGTWSPSYTTQRLYNLASAVISLIYPSNHTVSYSYGSDGRATSFSGYLAEGVNRTYSTGIMYSPFGGMSKEQFGTDTLLYNKLWYNSRGQLAEIRESTNYTGPTDTSWNRGAIINHYSDQCWGMCTGSPMTDNNGNVKKQDHWIPDNEQVSTWQTYTQWYSYDNLNRLQSLWEGRYVNGAGNPTQTIAQVFNLYDRYGNRTIDATQTSAGINAKQFTVITANNRLGVPTGQTGTMSYDPAGNLITDTYIGAGGRTYDGENRMVTAWGGNNQQQIYTYNADGQRVRRKVDGVETWQVYGMDGELLAEYAANAATTSPQKEYGYRNGQLLVTADCPAGPTADFIWVEDSLPAGAVPAGTNESWSWVGSNPSPYAGIQAHQSAIATGFHQHYFFAATGKLRVNSTDKLICYVYLDPSNMPNEIMLQWLDSSGSWEHRAYWGADVIENTYSRLYVGALPAGGQWVRLEVSVSAMGLSGSTLTGMAFKMNNGKATWDRAGKNGQGATGVQWLVSDQLGTPRMIFDKTGSLANTKRHDYLPFGEELFATQNGRTVQQGYTGDSVRQKFTLKERDNETGLDYFLARYYSSTQGRFTSPDEFTGGPDELYSFVDDASDNPTFYADLRKPQSLNKYQYAYNNPLRWIDPDGHDPEEPEPQDPKPVVTVPVPAGPGGLPVPVTISPSTPGPNDQQIIEGAKSVLDTVCDYTGITAVADWLRPKIMPTPAPTTSTPPTQTRQPVPPPPTTMGKGSTRDVRKINPGREASGKKGVEDARKKVNDLRSKPNKTPADKEALRRAERELQRQLDRLKKSEPDARRGRGDRR
jgi:RHS repeat-associated protein